MVGGVRRFPFWSWRVSACKLVVTTRHSPGGVRRRGQHRVRTPTFLCTLLVALPADA